ncbi:hypothetical protein BRY73_24235 [Ochrobactrum sp. P6BS-III]|nr:hypothetical protein BRY73_24235 [Ochrobactrum sp. P6BS-III]
MASTRLSIGNSNGVAALIAIAIRHLGDLEGEALAEAISESTQLAFWLVAAGILVGLLAISGLPKVAKVVQGGSNWPYIRLDECRAASPAGSPGNSFERAHASTTYPSS